MARFARSNSAKREDGRPGPWRIIGAAAMLTTMMTVDAAAQVKPIEEARADISNFWNAFLGRDLTQDELDQQTKYLLGIYGSDQCEYECMRTLAINTVDAEVFRTKPGQPEDLTLRDLYIVGAYVPPGEKNGLRPGGRPRSPSASQASPIPSVCSTAVTATG